MKKIRVILVVSLICGSDILPIVSNARVLYNAINRDQYKVFDDNCLEEDDGHGGGDGGRIANAGTNANKFDIEIYPNPTERGFDLKSKCKEKCTVTIIVNTITGQKILEKRCDLLESNCFVNTQLSSGTYLVSIVKETTKETVIRKLIISN
jgi:hypothetical protein